MILENSVKFKKAIDGKKQNKQKKKKVQINAITHSPDPRYTTAW